MAAPYQDFKGRSPLTPKNSEQNLSKQILSITIQSHRTLSAVAFLEKERYINEKHLLVYSVAGASDFAPSVTDTVTSL